MRAVVRQPKAARSGLTRPTIATVPEPTTVIAAALLLPFDASTIWILRKNQTVKRKHGSGW